MRPRCIQLAEAEPGMLLGAPIQIVNHGYLSLSLSKGQELTDSTIHQLVAHGGMTIFILEPEERSNDQIAVDAAAAAKRVMEVFSSADLSDPNVAALFDQILIYRSE